MKSREEIWQLAESIYGKGKVEDYEEGFVDGYTQCQRDMADKWFEYPKKIPPIHSENYLVFVDGYIEIDLFRGDHNKFNSELYNKNCTITHWKPLPRLDY